MSAKEDIAIGYVGTFGRIATAARLAGMQGRDLFEEALSSPPPGLSSAGVILIGGFVASRLARRDHRESVATVASLANDPDSSWLSLGELGSLVSDDWATFKPLIVEALAAKADEVIDEAIAALEEIAAESDPEPEPEPEPEP